ncbi:MAG: hypothetical protein PUE57_07325 [Lactimicrobium massiliense]|nr:hypothetical protein [Lactimicrobium massiliense]MDD6675450.1 hypothetical protein [Lactimicrobium massiliense]
MVKKKFASAAIAAVITTGAVVPTVSTMVIQIHADDSMDTVNEDGSMTFATKADHYIFAGASVDGNELSGDDDYTLGTGASTLTLSKSFLDSLTEGKHTLTIVSLIGTTSYDFTISRTVPADHTDNTSKDNTSDTTDKTDTATSGSVSEDGSMTFATKADHYTFISASVDGNELGGDDDFIMNAGAASLTLTKSFLDSLTEGTHTLTIVSQLGTTSYNFTISRTAPADHTDNTSKDNTSGTTDETDTATSGSISENTDKPAGNASKSTAAQTASAVSPQTGVNTDVAGYGIALIASVAIASYSMFNLVSKKRKHSN